MLWKKEKKAIRLCDRGSLTLSSLTGGLGAGCGN